MCCVQRARRAGAGDAADSGDDRVHRAAKSARVPRGAHGPHAIHPTQQHTHSEGRVSLHEKASQCFEESYSVANKITFVLSRFNFWPRQVDL